MTCATRACTRRLISAKSYTAAISLTWMLSSETMACNPAIATLLRSFGCTKPARLNPHCLISSSTAGSPGVFPQGKMANSSGVRVCELVFFMFLPMLLTAIIYSYSLNLRIPIIGKKYSQVIDKTSPLMLAATAPANHKGAR